MQTYLVEHYQPGLSPADLQEAAARVRTAAAALERKGSTVHYLRSTIVPGDEAVLSVFEAVSEAAVQEAYALAGVRFERISLALPEETV